LFDGRETEAVGTLRPADKLGHLLRYGAVAADMEPRPRNRGDEGRPVRGGQVTEFPHESEATRYADRPLDRGSLGTRSRRGRRGDEAERRGIDPTVGQQLRRLVLGDALQEQGRPAQLEGLLHRAAETDGPVERRREDDGRLIPDGPVHADGAVDGL